MTQTEHLVRLKAVSTRLEESATTQTAFKMKCHNSKTGKPGSTNDTTWEVTPNSC